MPKPCGLAAGSSSHLTQQGAQKTGKEHVKDKPCVLLLAGEDQVSPLYPNLTAASPSASLGPPHLPHCPQSVLGSLA